MYQDSSEPQVTSRRVQPGHTGPYDPFNRLKSADASAPPVVTARITGYRQLSAAEQDLINQIKAHAEATGHLVTLVQHHAAQAEGETSTALNPNRWAALAQTDLQTGFMKLVRAVAQPNTF